MLSLSLIALGLATIGAYATPAVRAVRNLEVVLSTPTDKVAFASELRVVATVKNVGDKDLEVIKFGTVLDDDLRAPSFIIKKGGKDIPFSSFAKFSVLTNHLSEPGGSLVIPAGGAAIAEHNVSTAYDFSTTGPGLFTFDSVPWFRVVGLDGITETHVANTRSISITVTDGVSKRELDLEKRTSVACEDASQTKFLKDGLTESKSLIHNALLHIQFLGDKNTAYNNYFGSNTIESVVKNLEAILNDKSTSTILRCAGPSDHCPDGIASYSPDNKSLYFCPVFFTDSYSPDHLCHDYTVDEQVISGGLVITQLAFAILGAQEIKDGCPDSRNLPNGDKLKNAANYECFVTQVYKDAWCR